MTPRWPIYLNSQYVKKKKKKTPRSNIHELRPRTGQLRMEKGSEIDAAGQPACAEHTAGTNREK